MPDPISQADLNRMFSYDPLTGTLVWRWRSDVPQATNTWLVGKTTGALSKSGYLIVKINQQIHLVHRIIFKMIHGRDPLNIDHIDGNRLNNRADNLREATDQQNNWNRRPSNTTGLPKGVEKHRRKFRAKILHNGNRIVIGSFDTAEEAGRAYSDKAKEIQREFAWKG